ncbi:MAG: LURP-one-related/scramblase family protein [Candidatus Dormibacteria bacterium]
MRYAVQEKFFAAGEDNTINREDGSPAYRVDGKALSLRNRMDIYDMQGNHVGSVQRKLMSMQPQYEIELPDGQRAVLHKKISFLKQKWILTVGSDELDLTGNLLSHDFAIARNGETIATISKAWVSWTSTYGVDVRDGENDLLILGAVLGLEAEQDAEQGRGSGFHFG